MIGTRKTEVFSIVDGKRLEAQACLLAPSLKAHLDPHHKAVAYVRQDDRGRLDPMSFEVLVACGVDIHDIPGTHAGPAPGSQPYPHGNKILAAVTPHDCEISVLIDTDTPLAASVDFEAALGDTLIAACVPDYAASAGSNEDWTNIWVRTPPKPFRKLSEPSPNANA